MDLQEYRRLLFTPCKTKQHMQNWIRVFTGLDLPDTTVAADSNSNPIDFLWEVYSKALYNDDESFSRVIAYAARGGFKTLGVSILEMMIMFHLQRNIGHMAATQDQSDRSLEYLGEFSNLPYISDFKVGESKKGLVLQWYYNQETDSYFTEKEWKRLSEPEKRKCKRRFSWVKVVICTMTGANGLHAEILVVDEIDTVEGDKVRGYKQAKNIPKARNGKLPITILVSTRKSAHGLVQQELDRAHKSGLHVRHWNVIDVTEKCSPARHKPEEPKIDLYVDNETLETLQEQTFQQLEEKRKLRFEKVPAFAGCASCPLFSGCKTRLATHQTGTSSMLSPIAEIASKFKDQETHEIVTELLCRKPSTEGLIYPRYNPEKHLLPAKEIAEILLGEEDARNVTDKGSLVAVLKENGASFYSGMDFGDVHDFATVTVAVLGYRAVVIDVVSEPNLELDDQMRVSTPLRDVYESTIFPDMAGKTFIKHFRRHGFKMRVWSKGPDSVMAGIQAVRTVLWSGNGKVRLFLVKGDSGCEFLGEMIAKYSFKLDKIGNVTDEPVKENDDALDAFRYVIQNVFAKTRVESKPVEEKEFAPVRPAVDYASQMHSIIRSHTNDLGPSEDDKKDKIKGSGRFFFDV